MFRPLYLVYNVPLEYAELVLNREVKGYLKTAIIYLFLCSSFAINCPFSCTIRYAIVSNYIKSRTINDKAISGTWYGQYVAYPEAEYELSFEMHANQRYKTVFQANWLSETDSPATGWHEYVAKGESGEVLYNVQIYNCAILKDTKLFIYGHMTVMKQDDWRGFKRIELHGDYRDYVPKGITTMLDRNYLLLFSE